jgi:hypothetical protein
MNICLCENRQKAKGNVEAYTVLSISKKEEDIPKTEREAMIYWKDSL